MLLIKGGTVKTITQGDIKDGEILIDEGKILAVGKGLDVPEGCEVYDASGMLVTPGLIDGHTHIGLDESAKMVLENGRWSGNIRELQNCIEKAVILSEGTTLTAKDIQLEQAKAQLEQANVQLSMAEKNVSEAVSYLMERIEATV